MTHLQLKNVSYRYDDTVVLQNIDLTVYTGEFVSIVGTSGVGKTTLFNVIAGILPLQEGTITQPALQNNSTVNNSKIAVSYMLQKDLLLSHKTVLENVMLPLILQKVSKKIAKQRALDILTTFQLAHVKDDYPKTLSGGMRQRVALLRTYLFGHSLFLLDEAFSALDAMTKMDVHAWYKNLQKQFNLTTLLITHDIDEAVLLSDRVYVLKGRPGTLAHTIAIQIDETADKDLQRLRYKQQLLTLLKD